MKKKQTPYEKAIISARKEFTGIAGKESWERESRFALELFPHLPADVLYTKRAMRDVAYTGVTLNPIFQEAYFIERDGKCFLDFTYRGLIKIATSEGAITSLSAGVVYSWDEIDCRQGTGSYLHILPSMNPPKDPDEIARNPKLIWEFVRAAYSVATFPNGQQDFIILPKHKLLKTWNMTCANASPINHAFPEEWLRKTAIIYHSKTLPKAQRLVAAVAVLNEHQGVAKKKGKPESRLMKRMKK